MDQAALMLIYREAIGSEKFSQDEKLKILEGLNLLHPIEGFDREKKITMLYISCQGEENRNTQIVQFLIDNGCPVTFASFEAALMFSNMDIMDVLADNELDLPTRNIGDYYNACLENEDEALIDWFRKTYPHNI